MKSINKKLFTMLVAMSMAFTACEDNSTGGNMEEPPVTTEVMASNQGTVGGNQVTIETVTAAQDGWIVIHRSNATNDGPQVPEIIGKTMVDAGENSNVMIQLEEGVSNQETLWAMLHIDTGTIGEYEFDGQNGFDVPVTVNENIVMSSFRITQTNPEIMVQNQVNKGNIFTLDVNAAEAGWIVIHASNADNTGPKIPEIIGKTAINEGINENVEISVEGEISAGDMLYPMMHFDTGTIGEYEFDGQNGFDGPVLDGQEIVVTSFTVLENSSTLQASDQMVVNNSITVDVESDTDGWVVIHRSNATNDGPQVPEIIGKAPITAGMNNDVQIIFNDGEIVEDGETLWPMVHYDTGEKGTYEFDGVGIHDQPVITANGVLMTSIMVMGSTTSSVMANDQAATDNMVTIAEAMMEEDGFVVLHRDNGNDAPVVPASIGKAKLFLGNNTNVQVMLDDGETLQAGDKVWAMLHIDNGTTGMYEFDGSAESNDPPVFDESNNIVMIQFTIQ
ncbi:MAG: hypothetical protein NXI08_00640 [bacterium]|nr:hypothetical protein [bacterium]